MYSRTGALAMTLPISTARLVSDSTSLVSWRRSSTTLVGVSTSTSVVAAAIVSEREVRSGGIRLIL